jgi:predicted RNase H-like HicB family nuclease
MRRLKVIVEEHPDGFVAYPVGIDAVIVGEGDTREEALADVSSAIRFHIETFGEADVTPDPPLIEVFVTEAVL